MAVDVNTVYRTVLLILNKEQRGYMTPDEFNRVAAQVQLEIFNRYFDDLNQLLKLPRQTTMNYSDRIALLDEKLAIFKKNIAINRVAATTTLSTPYVASQTGKIEAQGSSFSVGGTITVSGASTSGGAIAGYVNPTTYYIVDTNGYDTFTISLTKGGNPVSTTIGNLSQTLVYASPPIFVGTFILPSIVREVGSIEANSIEVQRLQKNEYLNISKSDLTAPSANFPIYLAEGSQLFVVPSTIATININYIKQVSNPVWGFEALASNNYRYDYLPSLSTQFELHESEQTNIITRILMYSGVIIKNTEIIQVAAAQTQAEQVNSKA